MSLMELMVTLGISGVAMVSFLEISKQISTTQGLQLASNDFISVQNMVASLIRTGQANCSIFTTNAAQWVGPPQSGGTSVSLYTSNQQSTQQMLALWPGMQYSNYLTIQDIKLVPDANGNSLYDLTVTVLKKIPGLSNTSVSKTFYVFIKQNTAQNANTWTCGDPANNWDSSKVCANLGGTWDTHVNPPMCVPSDLNKLCQDLGGTWIGTSPAGYCNLASDGSQVCNVLGGAWNGSTCGPRDGTQLCAKLKGQMIGGKCVPNNAQAMCSLLGGTWQSGGYCQGPGGGTSPGLCGLLFKASAGGVSYGGWANCQGQDIQNSCPAGYSMTRTQMRTAYVGPHDADVTGSLTTSFCIKN
jgi:hypothetical protein